MALARTRRYSREINYWPGFVDALSTLLLTITFLLSIFAVAQVVLSQEVNGRDTVLTRLNRQIAELTDLLSLEKTKGSKSDTEIGTLRATLDQAKADQARLQQADGRGRRRRERGRDAAPANCRARSRRRRPTPTGRSRRSMR